MAEAKKTESEIIDIEDLRKQIKALEEDLRRERVQSETLRHQLAAAPRSEKSEPKEDRKVRVKEAADKAVDDINKITKGFLYANLESLALTADVTRKFVDKTYERNTGDKRDTTFKQIVSLPFDMTEALFDALDDAVKVPGKVVDKFYEKYKEKEPESSKA
jgi:cell division septum initiation protein DivIVA